MDILKDVDWSYNRPTPRHFIADESFAKSATSRIIQNKFYNPLIRASSEAKKRVVKEKKPQTRPNEQKKKLFDSYIPGMKPIPQFPGPSCLSPEQHIVCLRVIESRTRNCINMPTINAKNDDLEVYNKLLSYILEEQKLYLEHTKDMWINKNCTRYFDKPPGLDKVNKSYKESAIRLLNRHPQHYEMATMLPLVYSNPDIPIEVELLQNIKDEVKSEIVIIPNLKKKVKLFYDEIESTSDVCEIEVTEDNDCEKFAAEYKADIVMSINALETLADNIPPYQKSWSLPIFVKACKINNANNTTHNIVYIDNAVQSPFLSENEKKLQCYKKLLKSKFISTKCVVNNTQYSRLAYENCDNCKSKCKSNEEMNCSNTHIDELKHSLDGDDIDGKEKNVKNLPPELSDSDDDDFGKLIIDDPAVPQENDIPVATIDSGMMTRQKKKMKLEVEVKTNNSICNCRNENKMLQREGNTFKYNLWRLGQQKDKNRLAKGLSNDITLLVRSQVDGIKVDNDETQTKILLTPKIEYQLEYGAEIMTSSEAALQWTSLKFRPNAKLLRARIQHNTGEVIMLEELNIQAVTSEALKNTLFRPENALGCFFNVLSKLPYLQPGQYILHHDPKHFAFSLLCRQADKKCENGFDLNAYYDGQKNILIKETAPWIPIDPNVVTPNLKFHNIMPCMFNPSSKKIFKTENKIQKNNVTRKNQKKKKKQNTNKKNKLNKVIKY